MLNILYNVTLNNYNRKTSNQSGNQTEKDNEWHRLQSEHVPVT